MATAEPEDPPLQIGEDISWWYRRGEETARMRVGRLLAVSTADNHLLVAAHDGGYCKLYPAVTNCFRQWLVELRLPNHPITWKLRIGALDSVRAARYATDSLRRRLQALRLPETFGNGSSELLLPAIPVRPLDMTVEILQVQLEYLARLGAGSAATPAVEAAHRWIALEENP